MEFLFYSSEKNGVGKRVQDIIEGLVSEKEVGIYRTVESLTGRLLQLPRNLSMSVILTTTIKELEDVIMLHELLFDIPIIFILPDRNIETSLKGQKLRPRFSSCIDSDFTDVSAVLGKMHGRLQRRVS